MQERQTGIHRSTYYLPLIRTYEEALARFQNTKPIRGRVADKPKWGRGTNPTVPLGRREDIDTYSMRYDEETKYVELVSYRHPLLTFTPDNHIVIHPKYVGLMESGMIERILGLSAWIDRRKVGINVNDERHVIEAGGTLVLKARVDKDAEDDDDNVRFKVLSKEVVYSYYVNRKRANNVRSRYSKFSTYLHGFLQLRKDMDTTTHDVLRVSLMEIADCVGYEYREQPVWLAGRSNGKEEVWKPDVANFRFIDNKPQGRGCLNRYTLGIGPHNETHWDRYQRQVTAFLAMVADDQPEEARVDNYYRATLTLLGVALGYIYRQPRRGEDAVVAIAVNRVQKAWDDVVMMYHSEEMLDKREIKANQLPNDRYNRYVTIMPTPEQYAEDARLQEARSL